MGRSASEHFSFCRPTTFLDSRSVCRPTFCLLPLSSLQLVSLADAGSTCATEKLSFDRENLRQNCDEKKSFARSTIFCEKTFLENGACREDAHEQPSHARGHLTKIINKLPFFNNTSTEGAHREDVCPLAGWLAPLVAAQPPAGSSGYIIL